MNHVDLFSGIGGFALAARNVWGGAYRNVCFCEINKYCQAVLRKNFGKDVVICDDIRTLTYASMLNANGNARKLQEANELEKSKRPKGRISESCGSGSLRIDLLTGGFPCQPFSQAGKRKGTSDERHLWPEMLRVIREFHPTWVVAENVRGLLTIDGGVVFETCCADLEREGYEVQPFVIPACAVGAPHRRDRVWIVGHLHGARRDERTVGEILGTEQSSDTPRGNSQDEYGSSSHHHHGLRLQEPGAELEAGRDRPDNQDARDTESKHERLHGISERRPQIPFGGSSGNDVNDPEPEELSDGDAGAVRGQTQNKKCQRPTIGYSAPEQWNENWLEVTTRFCGVDDGLPGEMDGATLSKAGHRVERLKALGNAIVPQVAEQIMKSIKEIEQC